MSAKLQRPNQQDAFIIPQFSKEGYQLFAVFDGYGGPTCSRMCAEFLPRIFRNLRTDYPDLGTRRHFFMAFYCLQSLAAAKKLRTSGCTATVVLIYKNQVWSANVGDSTAVLYTRTKGYIELTQKHQPKPEFYLHETERISKLAGRIEQDRVDGKLPRAIGNLQMQRFVSWKPFVRHIELDPREHAFIILATSGLWDHFDPKHVGLVAKNVDYLAAPTLAIFLKGLAAMPYDVDNTTMIGISLIAPENAGLYPFHEQIPKDPRN